jgi:hypothetical protein
MSRIKWNATFMCPRITSIVPVPSHPWYQSAAILVDNTQSCKYSYVLLMMGTGITQNMYSRLEINKSRIVASHRSSFIIILVMHGHMNIKLSLQSVFHTHWLLSLWIYYAAPSCPANCSRHWCPASWLLTFDMNIFYAKIKILVSWTKNAQMSVITR